MYGNGVKTGLVVIAALHRLILQEFRVVSTVCAVEVAGMKKPLKLVLPVV